MKQVDCLRISNALLEHVKKFLESIDLTPQLAIVQIGKMMKFVLTLKVISMIL